MLKCRLVKFCLVFASVAFLVACASPAEKLVKKNCNTVCHTTKVVFNKHYSKEMWQNTITAMQRHGMKATDAESAEIVNYLSQKYGVASK